MTSPPPPQGACPEAQDPFIWSSIPGFGVGGASFGKHALVVSYAVTVQGIVGKDMHAYRSFERHSTDWNLEITVKVDPGADHPSVSVTVEGWLLRFVHVASALSLKIRL